MRLQAVPHRARQSKPWELQQHGARQGLHRLAGAVRLFVRREISKLPDWQRSIAFVHQFALDSVGDGVGSLFYNNPHNIDGVAEALDGICKNDMAGKIRSTAELLKPFVEDGPANWQEILVEQCLNGAASPRLDELDKLLTQRWDELYSKLEERAPSKGWHP
jgi:hypothetical protein